MRKKIFKIIEVSDGNNIASNVYDYFMIVVIILSLVPLAFKKQYFAFEVTDLVCVGIFTVDYILRWITADYKYGKKSVGSFIRYPFGFMALIDVISILPTVTVLNKSFKLLRLFRMFKAFRVFRVFKAFRYSKSVHIVVNVLKNTKQSLAAVGTFALAYILISALIVFNIEPSSFNTFFDAVYWATVSLTTVGYGDIYPISVAGRIVTMFSSVFGIAIIALPAGIITAGYMDELAKSGKTEDGDRKDENKTVETVKGKTQLYSDTTSSDDSANRISVE